MDFTFVVSCRDVSFGNNYTYITHFEYDHCMGIIIYPQDISCFNILI